DINVMWNGSWNEDFDTRGVAYVAGLGGWWGGKAGIEKSPDYRLNVGTPLFDLVPGREYHIQAGSCAGHCFIIVDGRLIIEVTDPDPIDSSVHGKVGFEAFASQIAIREIKVYSLTCKMLREHYSREL
ncbi:MAG: hypothetical protein RSA97_07480, partial [Oscillospiraceae bacterium]